MNTDHRFQMKPEIMRTIMTSNLKPLRRGLCTLFLSTAALWALSTSAQAQLYIGQYGTNNLGEYNVLTGAVIKAPLITGLNGPVGLLLSGSILFVAKVLFRQYVERETPRFWRIRAVDRFWSGLPSLFRQGWDAVGHSTERRHQASPAARYQCRGNWPVLQTEKTREAAIAPGSRLKENIQDRVQRDAKFRKELLREDLETMFSGEITLGKTILRDYINATVGFRERSPKLHTPPKSLMLMFSPTGKSRASNLFEIVSFLPHREGVRFHVTPAALR
jgi:hypothetical protein